MATNLSTVFVLAHNIRSLYNVGSIFRTAEVFAVDKLFLTGYTGHPPNAQISKVALGAENVVPWEYHKSPVRLVQNLKKIHPKLKTVGLENNLKTGTVRDLPKYKFVFPLLLILGEEVGGIPKNLQNICDEFVEIPQLGKKESLNLSVAFGIAVFSIRFAKKSGLSR